MSEFLNIVAGLGPAISLKKTPTQVFSSELCETFKNTFFPSDCFSKYESLYMVAAFHSCLISGCSGNVGQVSRSISALHCKSQLP